MLSLGALKLDMNGIIHNCTHKDDDSATHRVSEDKMFIQIFNYIEHLYGKIKPQKLFFMAIDGVAPRAKMNQQRARRFRTALDAERLRQEAIRKGVEMPAEPPFDSNCITPGWFFPYCFALSVRVDWKLRVARPFPSFLFSSRLFFYLLF